MNNPTLPSQSAKSAEERQAISRLRQLLNEAGLLRASIIYQRRRCGKGYCRCATSKRHRHGAWSIGQTTKGQTQMKHLRPELLEEVQSWIGRYREAESLLEQISNVYWQRLRKNRS